MDAGPDELPARAARGRARGLADPDDPVEQALVAIAEGDRGSPHLVVRSVATGAELLPAGDAWPHAAGLLGLAAAELGDATTAEAVRTLLMPYADLTCGAGYRSFVGPMALHLGRLAAVVGDWAEAERHLTSALRQLAAPRARPWIALTQIALARTLHAPGRPGDRRWATALGPTPGDHHDARPAAPVAGGGCARRHRPSSGRPAAQAPGAAPGRQRPSRVDPVEVTRLQGGQRSGTGVEGRGHLVGEHVLGHGDDDEQGAGRHSPGASGRRGRTSSSAQSTSSSTSNVALRRVNARNHASTASSSGECSS